MYNVIKGAKRLGSIGYNVIKGAKRVGSTGASVTKGARLRMAAQAA